MNEKPLPRRTRGFRAAIIIGAILAGVLVVLMADSWNLSDAGRLGWAFAAIAAIAFVLLFAEPVVHSSWNWIYARAFESEKRDVQTQSKKLKRDSRLQDLFEELRTAHGWRWRYRLPWLMVSGTDARVEEIAPGLKRVGVMHVADTILVHAAPDNIGAAQWRRQIRQLRRKRTVDGLVHVTRTSDRIRPDDDLPRTLSTIATDLGWAAPITFLHAVEVDGNQPEQFEAIGALLSLSRRQIAPHVAEELQGRLASLEYQTATVGVQLCCGPKRTTYLAQVSAYIGEQRERIVAGWEALIASKWLRAPLDGVMFAPVFKTAAAGTLVGNEASVAPGTLSLALPVQPPQLVPVWQQIGRGVVRHCGKRVGFYWPNALASLVIVAAIAWCVWMTGSFIGNQQLMRDARETANAAVDARPQTAVAWRAQLALQQLIEKLEYRQQHGAPWYLRAGLSRNEAVLATLWQPYRLAATRNLQTPVVQTIADLLKAAGQARADSLQSQATRSSTYNALKTYLMLGDPSRADPDFLEHLLVALWPRPVEMPLGEREDTGGRLAAFYAEHLAAHPDWRITPDMSLVTSTRNGLVTQMGLASAADTVYQSILDDAKGKYADASLGTLLNGTDAHGLFTMSQTVPGIYTRAAWDGVIAEAIDKAASERRVSSDWVLTGAQPTRTIGNTLTQGAIHTEAALNEARAAVKLREQLRARYFAEYAVVWQGMLNSLHWQPAANLNGAIDQLTRLADAQTSPLIALMKSVDYQAQAGRPSQALTDTLVRKAQNLFGKTDETAAPQGYPLDNAFGPLLTLMGDTVAPSADGKGHANIALNGVSLSRYLTAVTTMRLKLQQIEGSNDAQAMARSLAQAVFQGKLSDLSQARDDAALTAASLGAAWASFGDAVFAQPLEAAWQTILQPAAASLNEAWRVSIAAPFNAAMSGRYPFADTPADASFAELGRYVRPDTGLIARFIAAQLAGVLKLNGDHWAPNELAPQALRFDPKFLQSIGLLSSIGSQLYLQGDAGERFDLMARPTPSVTRTTLTVDGNTPVVYFNQQESWTPMAWPGNGLNGHAVLTWESVGAGLRVADDLPGDWAFLRLLQQADVKQLDGTRYLLTWNAANGAPLHYVMRTQLGAGPLALLKLRGFRMPERIFIVGKGGDLPVLPPLPEGVAP
ncbi:Type VI secretion protein VasK [Burkholderia diffusa]|uniref:ImcF-related family protein n=1 Tax=Burkholderia diffusa TaxID=488732 RepID=UPI001CAB9AD2|nr:ImcF-related family protein [Burkholderia diffusa]CAG9266274.1 Type VI secretion protein VasK [Burkholderia diffusa]